MITGTTRFYGIFADPISHVKAPAAFNEIIASRGLDAVFLPFHVLAADFSAAVEGMHKLRNFAGFTLTIPHKAAAARLCDRLGPIAAACGAVNAVRFEADGSLSGETFDGIGMASAIAAIAPLTASTRVLLVGAGGAGRAIAFAMAQQGIGQLQISNRSLSAAYDLAEAVTRHFQAVDVSVGSPDPCGFDIAINATSLGLNGQGPLPFDPGRTDAGAVVADVVMEPAISPLLEAASRLGRAIVPGAHMLKHQVEQMADYLGMMPR